MFGHCLKFSAVLLSQEILNKDDKFKMVFYGAVGNHKPFQVLFVLCLFTRAYLFIVKNYVAS